MRYTDEITFVKVSEESHYDPESGEWVEGEPERTSTLGNVTDLGTDRVVTIFGDITEEAKVIRTMPLFCVPVFDFIEFEGKTYKEATKRNPLGRNSLIVKEVATDGTERN